MAAWNSGWIATARTTIRHHPSSRVGSMVTLVEHHNVANEVDRLMKVPPGIGVLPEPPNYYSKDVSPRDIGIKKQISKHICIV